MNDEIERDMPECEKWNMMEDFAKFTPEQEVPSHDVHEPTTYELAEAELKSEQKYLVQEMMGEQYDKYFWNEKHA
jgi:hypothetical protein